MWKRALRINHRHSSAQSVTRKSLSGHCALLMSFIRAVVHEDQLPYSMVFPENHSLIWVFCHTSYQTSDSRGTSCMGYHLLLYQVNFEADYHQINPQYTLGQCFIFKIDGFHPSNRRLLRRVKHFIVPIQVCSVLWSTLLDRTDEWQPRIIFRQSSLPSLTVLQIFLIHFVHSYLQYPNSYISFFIRNRIQVYFSTGWLHKFSSQPSTIVCLLKLGIPTSGRRSLPIQIITGDFL
jgi:hypothetical protein